MVRPPTSAGTPTLWDDPDQPTWSVPELGEAIGAHLRVAFPDEVWPVDIAPLTDGSLLPYQIAEGLRLRDHSDRTIADIVIDHGTRSVPK